MTTASATWTAPNPKALYEKHAALFQPATLADLPAFKCGNAQNEDAATGCTVIVAEAGATCSVAVRGGGPATRETDLLKPENMVEAVHAVVLSGGSAFGLAASTGVMEELAARKVGFELLGAYIPIVTGACLFDLVFGENAHPDAAMGAAATRAALSGEPFLEGNVGAGCGATVGKMLAPEQAMKTGLGVYGLRSGDVVAVAIVAVNALGTVVDDAGTPLAGHRREDGSVMDPLEPVALLAKQTAGATEAEAGTTPCTNTTISCVLTNAKLTKAQAQKVSSIAHDGYARAIQPVHTANDGDTVFTFASNEVEASFDIVAILATEAMQGAIQRAATEAQGSHELPTYSDLL